MVLCNFVSGFNTRAQMMLSHWLLSLHVAAPRSLVFFEQALKGTLALLKCNTGRCWQTTTTVQTAVPILVMTVAIAGVHSYLFPKTGSNRHGMQVYLYTTFQQQGNSNYKCTLRALRQFVITYYKTFEYNLKKSIGLIKYNINIINPHILHSCVPSHTCHTGLHCQVFLDLLANSYFSPN